MFGGKTSDALALFYQKGKRRFPRCRCLEICLECAFFNVRIFNLYATSNHQPISTCYRKHDNIIKHAHEQCVSRRLNMNPSPRLYCLQQKAWEMLATICCKRLAPYDRYKNWSSIHKHRALVEKHSFLLPPPLRHLVHQRIPLCRKSWSETTAAPCWLGRVRSMLQDLSHHGMHHRVLYTQVPRPAYYHLNNCLQLCYYSDPCLGILPFSYIHCKSYSDRNKAILGFNWHFSLSSLLTRSCPKNSSISTMAYGIIVRLADMKALVVTKQQCTNCIGTHWDIRRTWISPEAIKLIGMSVSRVRATNGSEIATAQQD